MMLNNHIQIFQLLQKHNILYTSRLFVSTLVFSLKKLQIFFKDSHSSFCKSSDRFRHRSRRNSRKSLFRWGRRHCLKLFRWRFVRLVLWGNGKLRLKCREMRSCGKDFLLPEPVSLCSSFSRVRLHGGCRRARPVRECG